MLESLQGWFSSYFRQGVTAPSKTKLFFEGVSELKALPEVLALISLEGEVEASGRFSDKAGPLALCLSGKVSDLATCYCSSLSHKDAEDILSFVERIRKGAVMVSDRRMGIPLFLSFFGVSENSFSHARLQNVH